MKSYSAGGIVINQKGEFLVVNQMGKSWSFPKGHIDMGEEPLAAAIREVGEESGITDLKLIKDLGTYERPNMFNANETKVIQMYLFITSETELRPTDADNPEARWVPKNEVVNLLSAEKDREFFQKFLAEDITGPELMEGVRRS